MGHKQRAGQANCPKTNIRVGITFGGQVNLGKGNISEAVNFAKKAFQETAKIEAIDIIAPIGANLVNSYKLNTDFSNAIDIGSKVIRI